MLVPSLYIIARIEFYRRVSVAVDGTHCFPLVLVAVAGTGKSCEIGDRAVHRLDSTLLSLTAQSIRVKFGIITDKRKKFKM